MKPALCTALTLFTGAIMALAAGTPPAAGPALATPATTTRAYAPFSNLPPPMTRPTAGSDSLINAGTAGITLSSPLAPAGGGRTTIAILGDLAPAAADRERLLRMAVSEINLLRPEAVLTLGNLVPGLTRSGADYVEQVHHTRSLLDELKMPWFPCAGMTDTFSGTRDPADRRFQDLYQRYLGPLYFSANIGGTEGGHGSLHVIVLDSQELLPTQAVPAPVVPTPPSAVPAPARLSPLLPAAGISDAQLQWLRTDLNHAFQQGQARGLILLLHQPLWQSNPDNWQKVHALLVEFNRRPTVTFPESGGGTGALGAHGPRALAVFASARGAYDLEPTRDGIRYYILGPSAAAPRANEGPEAIRHFTLVKLEATGEMHTALVQLGAADASAAMILPEDTITAAERGVIDAIAAWDDTAFGIDGIVDERGTPLGRGLTFHLANPLAEAFDVQLRMLPEAEGGGWDFLTPPIPHHLTASAGAGARYAGELAIHRIHAGTDLPLIQAVVRWADPRGRVHEVVLPRPVAVAPSLEIAVSDKPIPLDDSNWSSTPGGIATARLPEPDAPRKPDPTISVRADLDHVYIQVHVIDASPSDWPSPKLDPAVSGGLEWGGLPSDAVTISWARGDRQIQRLWMFPHAPEREARPAKPQLWINSGLGTKQTPLEYADAKLGFDAIVKLEEGGYTVTFSLPRKIVCDEIPAAPAPTGLPLLTPPSPPTRLAATMLLNVNIHDNDQTARTWTKSWALEDAGPDAWAHLQLTQTNTPPPGHAP